MTSETGVCAEVLLLRPRRLAGRPLTYRVPPGLFDLAPGFGVVVPLGRRVVHGIVTQVGPCREVRALREIVTVPSPVPLVSGTLLDLARWLAEETSSPLGDAVRCLVPPEVVGRTVGRASLAVLRDRERLPRRLGPRQRQVVGALERSPEGVRVPDLASEGGRDALRRLVAAGAVQLVEPHPGRAPAEGGRGGEGGRVPLVVWGEPQARWRWIVDAASAVARRDQALVVVPETSRVAPLLSRLREAVGDARVVAFHSGLGAVARREAWLRIREGTADVVVGTRSALFLPLARLGLLVVDDEQSPAHKAQESPRYHSRDVALERARREGAQAVLAALAPAVETYAAVSSGRFGCVRLASDRPPPPVTVVDMRSEREAGLKGFLSRQLVDAIRRHLRARGRVALFVSRAGYAPVLRCRECGRPVRCPRCHVAVPYDRTAGVLRCRVCGAKMPAPDVCPSCKGSQLRAVGAGSQRVEEIVGSLFPGVRRARVDRDTADDLAATVDLVGSGRVRLVVGTQALLRAAEPLRRREASPTLVAVVDVDAALFRPDFRAAERTFHDVKAMASMASGEVILQTRLPDHPAVVAVRTGEDDGFYEAELRVRREFGYPPFSHLARLVISGPEPECSQALAERASAAARASGVDVLGPAPVGTSRGVRVQILLRGPTRAAVRGAVRAAQEDLGPLGRNRLIVDMDPQEPL